MKDTAIFAAGCFWGVQYYFDQVPGVISTETGYIGGSVKTPTYDQVCSGSTGHAEAVRIAYNPKKVDYETLLRHFFRMHDPTQVNRQGPDIGEQYRSAIFYTSEDQKEKATKVINELNQKKFADRIVTELKPAAAFWSAEDYHQKFTERTGRGMCHAPYAPLKRDFK